MGIYQRPGSSMWYARYTDADGKTKRVSLGTESTKEAQSRFAEIERQQWAIQQGLVEAPTAKGGKTLQDAYDRALKVHYTTPAKREEAAMRWKVLSSLIDPLTTINRIDREMAEDARAKLLETPLPRGKGTYSPTTANRVVSLLGRLLTLSVDWGWIKHSPRMPKTPEHGRETVLTDAQIDAMWKALKEAEDGRVAATLDLFVTLHHEALRLSEALRLPWDQVDTDAGLLVLKKKTTKGHKAVTKPLTPAVLEILRRRKTNGLPGPFSDINEYMVRKAWSYAKEIAGIESEEVVRHTLRHTAATKLISEGHDVMVVKEYLGHSCIQTTMKYIHANHAILQSAAKTLGGCVESVLPESTKAAQ